MTREHRCPTSTASSPRRELAETVDAIAAIAAARRQHPVDSRRPHRPVEPGRGGDGARPRRPPRRGARARTSGCARMQHADGCVARVLPSATRSRTRRSTPTSPATSRPACGTTTSSPATPRSCDELWPTVERAIDYALDYQTRDRRDRVARRRPRRRRAAHRLVEHPPQPALRDRHRRAARPRAPRLGALARRARHRHRAPARRVPRQGPLGDGLVLPDPRRRAPRPAPRRRASRACWEHVRRRGPRRALRVRPPVGHRGRDVRAGDGARRDRRATSTPASSSRGCSSCAPTAAATGPALNFDDERFHLDGELYPVEQPTWNSAAVVLAAQRARRHGPTAGPVPRRGASPTGLNADELLAGRRRDRRRARRSSPPPMRRSWRGNPRSAAVAADARAVSGAEDAEAAGGRDRGEAVGDGALPDLGRAPGRRRPGSSNTSWNTSTPPGATWRDQPS